VQNLAIVIGRESLDRNHTNKGRVSEDPLALEARVMKKKKKVLTENVWKCVEARKERVRKAAAERTKHQQWPKLTDAGFAEQHPQGKPFSR
jgi:hypothetical protein